MNPIVYIKVPTHIRQWAYRAYGNPVVFPAIGNEVAVLRKFTSRPPVVNLSPIDQENIQEMQQADASQLHQSVKHTFHDEEFEQSRWLTHPKSILPSSCLTPRLSLCESTTTSGHVPDVPSKR